MSTFQIGDIVRIKATEAGLPPSGAFQIVEIDHKYTCPYRLRMDDGFERTATAAAIEYMPPSSPASPSVPSQQEAS